MLPDHLQTSPYLTLVRPGDPPPVVYVTDTIGPEYPVMSEPDDAVFGGLHLDRIVRWHHDPAALRVLHDAAADPVPTGDLVARASTEAVTDLVRRGWLQHPDDLCREYELRTGQIEITAHCNWGCEYCPVSVDPKPRATMPMDLFTEIVEKLQPHPKVRYVTFHFFNEPTLDRHFAERIEVLRRYGTKLSLATNASALTKDKVRLLADSGVMHHLVVNLPTDDEEEFGRLTGARTYTQSLRNLEHAITAEAFPITLSVNGIGEAGARNVERLRHRYEPRGVEVAPTQTCDRAGELDNDYAQDIRVDGRLRGCSWPLNHAYFSVTGKLFICCNDYYQREVFGDVRDGTLHEIMTSPAAVALRRRVFGVDRAPDSYLCRTCHDQRRDFPHRQFRPVASFPIEPVAADGRGCCR